MSGIPLSFFTVQHSQVNKLIINKYRGRASPVVFRPVVDDKLGIGIFTLNIFLRHTKQTRSSGIGRAVRKNRARLPALYHRRVAPTGFSKIKFTSRIIFISFGAGDRQFKIPCVSAGKDNSANVHPFPRADRKVKLHPKHHLAGWVIPF